MTQTYDTAIIGAGINGCASAHFLSQAGQKVILIDQEGVAAGGSGAAGAFISPKFTKGGRLKALLEEAYLFSLDFYRTDFPKHIQTARLLQIANSEENAVRLAAFKETTTLAFSEVLGEMEALLTPYAKASDKLVLEEGGVVDAEAMCTAMAEGLEFSRQKAAQLSYRDGLWQIGDVRAKAVVLATGSYDMVADLPYLELRRVWGHRIDIKTTTRVPYSLHHHLSVSPSSADGTVAVGATHDLHHDPFGEIPYDIEAGRRELLEKALKSVTLENIEVIRDYTGLRSGSNDYLPIVGSVVDAKETMGEDFKVSKLKRMKDEEFSFFPELYMINGTGGYGFVLAPYLAAQLAKLIVERDAVESDLTPTRFFRRWAKRQR